MHYWQLGSIGSYIVPMRERDMRESERERESDVRYRLAILTLYTCMFRYMFRCLDKRSEDFMKQPVNKI